MTDGQTFSSKERRNIYPETLSGSTETKILNEDKQ
jgi:hypothetical protein